MKTQIRQHPPRLILGFAVLFWGAMTDRPLIALLMAMVAEARHWTTLRWDFHDAAYGRAWQLCVAMFGLAAVLVWLDGNRLQAMPVLLSWAPLLLLPLLFVQSYGLRGAIPLNELSFFARRWRERNHRAVWPGKSREFDARFVWFVCCLVAASVGRRASGEVFLPVTVILCGWMLWALGRARLRQLLPLLLLAALMAVCGRFGIERAERWLGWRHDLSARGFDPNFASTRIGQVGAVQLSPEIQWRLFLPDGNPAPRLLRTGLFNTYLGRNWQNHRVASVDFRDLDTRTIDDAAHYMIGSLPEVRGSDSLIRYRLRGAANAETPVPLPGGATALRDFRLDGVESNSFGTVRLYPSDPVIDGWVLWEPQSHHESAPLWDEDLRIPLVEREVVRKVREDIGILDRDELAVSLGKLRRYLSREFRYTQDLKISKSPYQASGLSAIGQFLTEERAGHCEYFATAAALILRDAGIPSRYATGYALLERGGRRGEFVIRRLHGHAWCRVWDAKSEKWMDFDPTPPAALAPMALNEIGSMQRIYDQLLCWREDFFLWRNESSNRRGIMLALAGLIFSVCAWIGWRMWSTRRRLPTSKHEESYPTMLTPLRDLEPMVERLLGPRAVGQSYANWLMGLHEKLPDPHLLERAIFLHQRLRFDPGPVGEDVSSELQKITDDLNAALVGLSASHENLTVQSFG